MLKPLFFILYFVKFATGIIQKKSWADSWNQPMLKTFFLLIFVLKLHLIYRIFSF